MTAPLARHPPPLRRGDTVHAVAPSGPPDEARCRAGIAMLERWGFTVVVGEHAFAGDASGFLAAPDEERATDLQRALDDDRVAGVFCLRGGYGCQRLLERLDLSAVAARPKAFVGFSDVTALHVALLQRAGVVTFHGPSLQWDGRRLGEAAESSLRAAVTGAAPPALRGEPLAPGSARGTLVGGNLTVLAHLCGTPEQLRGEGRVVLLEDVAEPPYRIDRAVTQLRRSGALEGVAGLALGTFVGCDDPGAGGGRAGGGGARRVLAAATAELGVPAVWDLPLGHGRGQLTVTLGTPVELDGDAGTLRWP